MKIERKKSGNARKIGRALDKCKRYRDRGMRTRNKARKLRKHLGKQPNDKNAVKTLKKLIGV